jgi:tRNA pseudouridine38-40 synthase
MDGAGGEPGDVGRSAGGAAAESPAPESPARTLRLLLRYDGTDFFGWQIQPGRRTVQGEIERAAGIILAGAVRVTGAGRTDRGVHALGQVASLATHREIPAESLRRGLNSLLPPDIHVDAAAEAPPGFHARFSAVSRSYRYHLSRRAGPIRRRYAWIVENVPAAGAMAAASEPLLGSHLFDGFTGSEGLAGDTRCRVRRIAWRDRGDRVTLVIEADRFVNRMVRNIVGTLVGLGAEGRLVPAAVAELLEARLREKVHPTAPPQGLFFLRALYPPDDQIPPYRGGGSGVECPEKGGFA